MLAQEFCEGLSISEGPSSFPGGIMSNREMWPCTHCGAEYVSAWAAAVCCDEAAFGDAD